MYKDKTAVHKSSAAETEIIMQNTAVHGIAQLQRQEKGYAEYKR